MIIISRGGGVCLGPQRTTHLLERAGVAGRRQEEREPGSGESGSCGKEEAGPPRGAASRAAEVQLGASPRGAPGGLGARRAMWMVSPGAVHRGGSRTPCISEDQRGTRPTGGGGLQRERSLALGMLACRDQVGVKGANRGSPGTRGQCTSQTDHTQGISADSLSLWPSTLPCSPPVLPVLGAGTTTHHGFPGCGPWPWPCLWLSLRPASHPVPHPH